MTRATIFERRAGRADLYSRNNFATALWSLFNNVIASMALPSGSGSGRLAQRRTPMSNKMTRMSTTVPIPMYIVVLHRRLNIATVVVHRCLRKVPQRAQCRNLALCDTLCEASTRNRRDGRCDEEEFRDG